MVSRGWGSGSLHVLMYEEFSSYFLFKLVFFFFGCGPFCKVFIESVTILLLFLCFSFLATRRMGP